MINLDYIQILFVFFYSLLLFKDFNLFKILFIYLFIIFFGGAIFWGGLNLLLKEDTSNKLKESADHLKNSKLNLFSLTVRWSKVFGFFLFISGFIYLLIFEASLILILIGLVFLKKNTSLKFVNFFFKAVEKDPEKNQVFSRKINLIGKIFIVSGVILFFIQLLTARNILILLWMMYVFYGAGKFK